MASRRARSRKDAEAAKWVAWANFRHSPPSYVPHRTRERAEAGVRQSEISATQEGPYSVVALTPLPDAESALAELRAEVAKAVADAAEIGRGYLEESHRADTAEARLERVRGLLTQLHALVWGECPSLLNEDSGGDGQLDVDIRAFLGECSD